jgi:hypothetical protein
MDQSDELNDCTIIVDRYSGTYSGGRWTAWNMHRHQIPDEPDGGDITAVDFWLKAGGSDNQPLVGRGDTPDEAYADLKRRLASR